MPEMTLGPRKLVGEHVLSEANETRAREHVYLAATDVVIPPGTILGKVTAAGDPDLGRYRPLDPDADDGTEEFAGILFGRGKISVAPQRVVAHVRDSEHNEKKITLLNPLDPAQMTAMRVQAEAKGIIFSRNAR